MGGELHYVTTLRVFAPRVRARAARTPRSSRRLPEPTRGALVARARGRDRRGGCPTITEDTMPGELANIIAGPRRRRARPARPQLHHRRRLRLVAGRARRRHATAWSTTTYDAVVTGGVDRNMGAADLRQVLPRSARSRPTARRPFDDGANGFVMGEGGGAVRAASASPTPSRPATASTPSSAASARSSDGKGKGITAPNPVGQILAIAARLGARRPRPRTVGLIEGHGTSTRVGDVAEVESLAAVFADSGLPPAQRSRSARSSRRSAT